MYYTERLRKLRKRGQRRSEKQNNKERNANPPHKEAGNQTYENADLSKGPRKQFHRELESEDEGRKQGISCLLGG